MNHYDVSILPSEPRYWVMILGAIVGGFLFVKYFDHLSKEKREPYLKRLGFALICISGFLPIYTIFIPEHLFSFHRSLPLHFCSLNIWLIGFNCFFKSRKLFVYTFFMALIGGFYSVLTPLLTVGDAPLVIVHYIIVHTALFTVPIVMIRLYGMRLKYYDWIRGYLFSAAISTVMVFINSYLNLYVENTGGASANYMFVTVAPAVNNPFLFEGLQWPFYLIPVHLGLFLHILIINMIYRKREQNPIVSEPRLWQ
jgi:hypothetical integral membrane protein (TIGR02206 family)